MKTLTTASLLSASVIASDERCNALILSGGGANGAWEAGVLYGLTHFGDPSDFRYDTVTGVSVGAINSLLFTVTEPGDEVNTTELLSDMWRDLHSSDVYTSSWLHEGTVFFHSSLYDDAPLLEYLSSILSPYTGYKRPFAIGSTDSNTGEYYVFNQTNTEFGRDTARAAVSSASIPFIFPPQVWRDRVFMDGGTVWNIDVPSAINACSDIVGDDLSRISIDVLLCGP
jgi:NTE family protein